MNASNSVRLLSASAVSVGLLTGAAVAADDSGVEIGVLTCSLESETNVIIYTNETFNCVFESKEGVTFQYDGEIEAVGIDLEFKTAETLKWAVIAPTLAKKPGVLAGEYYGASAGASLGKGVSANALVGGSDKQFTLQPLSGSLTDGAGAAVTLDNFTLTAAP